MDRKAISSILHLVKLKHSLQAIPTHFPLYRRFHDSQAMPKVGCLGLALDLTTLQLLMARYRVHSKPLTSCLRVPEEVK